MNLNAAAGLRGMLKEGMRSYEGLEGAIIKNIDAAKAITTMVRTSLGPNGMNKLVVNHLEKIIVSSDCATILKELEVQHPAANILVLAAKMQESEYGDNTNFVLSFAGELLKLAESLLRSGLHTSEVVSGYQKALDHALEIYPTLVIKSVEDVRNEQEMHASIKSVIATKQYGYEDFLSDLIVKACLTTLSPQSKNPKLNLDSVRIVKCKGGSVLQSAVVKGMVFLRDTEGLIKRAVHAKIAVFGCGIEASSTEAKGTILLKNAEELRNYNKSEERKMEEMIEAIASSGVQVVVCNGSISEMALHFLDKFNLMVVKIMSKYDLRRICSATGATASIKLGALTPEEIGECSLVEVREVGGRKVIVFDQQHDEDTAVATIVVRASTENVLNDVERALDDGIHAFKTLLADKRLLCGAGAVELALSKRIKALADANPGLDQYGMRKFAEALDVVPRTLAENSGCDPTSIMHALHTAQSGEAKETDYMGFDVEENAPFNALAAGIYDVYATKVNAIRLAVDAAITVLKVDQIVMAKPAGGPKPRAPGPNDPDDD